MRNILLLMKSASMYFLIAMVNASKKPEEDFAPPVDSDLSAHLVKELYEMNSRIFSRNKSFITKLLTTEYKTKEAAENAVMQFANNNGMVFEESYISPKEGVNDTDMECAENLIKLLFSTSFFQTKDRVNGQSLIPENMVELLITTFSSSLQFEGNNERNFQPKLMLFEKLLIKIWLEFEDLANLNEKYFNGIGSAFYGLVVLVNNRSISVWEYLLKGCRGNENVQKQVLEHFFGYEGPHTMIYDKMKALEEIKPYLDTAGNTVLLEQMPQSLILTKKLEEVYKKELIPNFVDLYLNLYKIYVSSVMDTSLVGKAKERKKIRIRRLLRYITLLQKLTASIVCSFQLANPKAHLFILADIETIVKDAIISELKYSKRDIYDIIHQKVSTKAMEFFGCVIDFHKGQVEQNEKFDGKSKALIDLQYDIMTLMFSTAYTEIEIIKEMVQFENISKIIEIILEDEILKSGFSINQYLKSKQQTEILLENTLQSLEDLYLKSKPSYFPILQMIFILVTFNSMGLMAYLIIKRRNLVQKLNNL
ncbi:hypothetical protein GINT2_000804 [Glugoides intestinalis]